MKRVPENELMNEPQQVKVYSEADFSCSDNAFLQNLDEFLQSVNKSPVEGTRIVDLGCGPGNITHLLSKRWPLSLVRGIDGSEAMLDIAKSRQNNICLNNKSIKYDCIDISLLANNTNYIGLNADVVVSNSFLHHLHDPSCLWKAIRKLLVPGSFFFHRDLRRPSSTKEAIELQQKHLPNAPSLLIRDFLASLHASFTVYEVKEQLLLENFQNFKVREVEDRYLEIYGSV